MKTSLQRSVGRGVARVLLFAGGIGATAVVNVEAQSAPSTPGPSYQMLPADQLDSIVAPIALYADPLLAQVMLAATYPQQIDDAAKWVRANGTGAVDSQPWDVSVKAVAHYPAVLNLLDSNLDWTTWIGAAYANQSTDMMSAVQHMRSLAQANGNLVTTPQQQVVTDNGNISVWPAQPQVIYVPVYNPAVVYNNSCRDVWCTPYVGFSVGYPIGSWLMYDWDWPGRRIYYTGWVGAGWIARSRPFVRMSAVYVNDRFRAVSFNRAVMPVGRLALNRVANGGAARVAVAGGASFRAAPVQGVQRALVTRVAAPAVRSQSVAPYRAASTRVAAGTVGRQGYSDNGARQAAPAYRSAAAPSRAAYAAPRQSAPARQSYAAPRRAAAPAQRQTASRASAAPRGGPSGGGRTASRSGHGR